MENFTRRVCPRYTTTQSRPEGESLPKRVQSDEEGRLFPYKYDWLYQSIMRLDREWWPHRFRIERASQLVIEYDYNVPELMRFFGWSSSEIATKYARLSLKDLFAKMERGEICARACELI